MTGSRHIGWEPLAVAVVVFAAGCEASGPNRRAICPDCGEPIAGETGDFGGTPSLCESVNERAEVLYEDARRLGFDVDTLSREFGRDFVAPLRWSVDDHASGVQVTGYQADTVIRGAFRLLDGDAFHVRPSPVLCDGSVCLSAGVSFEQGSCSERLEVGVEVEFATDDGAVEGTAKGVASVRRQRASSGTDSAATVRAFARLDLRTAAGSLRLEVPSDIGRYSGSLKLSVTVGAGMAEGRVWPEFTFESSSEDSEIPISGVWSEQSSAKEDVP